MGTFKRFVEGCDDFKGNRLRRISATDRRCPAIRRSSVHNVFRRVYSSPHRLCATSQRYSNSDIKEHNMDILNAFFVFNVTASIAVLVAFFSMRETVSAGFAAAKEKVATFNMAGAAGAATSMVLLASVANLFR
jgi:hypothetical protein